MSKRKNKMKLFKKLRDCSSLKKSKPKSLEMKIWGDYIDKEILLTLISSSHRWQTIWLIAMIKKITRILSILKEQTVSLILHPLKELTSYTNVTWKNKILIRQSLQNLSSTATIRQNHTRCQKMWALINWTKFRKLLCETYANTTKNRRSLRIS